jgi:hypothetical protein
VSLTASELRGCVRGESQYAILYAPWGYQDVSRHEEPVLVAGDEERNCGIHIQVPNLPKSQSRTPKTIQTTLIVRHFRIEMGFYSHGLFFGLPRTPAGYDSIWVVIDQLTKIYIDEIVRLHGAPVSIISYRDPKFPSHFWGALQNTFETRLHLSTSHHPKTNW